MPRQEAKFLLSPAQAETMHRMLLPHVRLDPYAAMRRGATYTVMSLYLDTHALDCYHEKLAGLKDRLKLRVRGYDDVTADSPVYLELKRKSGAVIAKRRSSVRYGDLRQALSSGDVESYLLHAENPDEAAANAREFLFHVHRRSLAPVINVVYEREAFCSLHEEGVRITLDRALRSQLAEGLAFPPGDAPSVSALGQQVILEVKTDWGLPLWLRMIVGRVGVSKQALSKYILCVDSLSANGHRCGPTRGWTVRDRSISLYTPES